MKVIWSAKAVRQLRDIVTYIGNDNPPAARRVATRLLKRSRQLTQLPLTGRRLPDIPMPTSVKCSNARIV